MSSSDEKNAEQGSTLTPISDEFAEYALNLAVTNIVSLVGIYKRGKITIWGKTMSYKTRRNNNMGPCLMLCS